MYIRRTSIKSRQTGEPYFPYRLVESVRTDTGVRQRTVANLGRHFEVPKAHWSALAQRIGHLITGQSDCLPADLAPQGEQTAQRVSALAVHTRARLAPQPEQESGDIPSVDVDSLDRLRPRSVRIEQVGLDTLCRLGLDQKRQDLGFNSRQLASALGTLIAPMVGPGSTLYTHAW